MVRLTGIRPMTDGEMPRVFRPRSFVRRVGANPYAYLNVVLGPDGSPGAGSAAKEKRV